MPTTRNYKRPLMIIAGLWVCGAMLKSTCSDDAARPTNASHATPPRRPDSSVLNTRIDAARGSVGNTWGPGYHDPDPNHPSY